MSISVITCNINAVCTLISLQSVCLQLSSYTVWIKHFVSVCLQSLLGLLAELIQYFHLFRSTTGLYWIFRTSGVQQYSWCFFINFYMTWISALMCPSFQAFCCMHSHWSCAAQFGVFSSEPADGTLGPEPHVKIMLRQQDYKKKNKGGVIEK